MPYTTLSFFGDRLHLLDRCDDDLGCPHQSSHVRLTPVRPVHISGIVQSARSDPRMMTRLRHFVARNGATLRVGDLTDAELIRQVTHYLESGRLRVVQCGVGERAPGGGGSGGGASSAAGAASTVADRATSRSTGDDKYNAPPPPPKPAKTWVEFELRDWEGNPAANQRYEIRLPDGSLQEGRLDGSGRARFTGIDPGTCQVTFPDFDGSEWRES
jgi:hypothetical protein